MELSDFSRFMDLINGPPVAALTTVMPNGQPQTTVVWCDFDGAFVRVNTMRGFRKEKNMRANPKVTLLCFDPRQPLRYLEIRGTVVEMTEAGALQHLDHLSELYTGKSPYFGQCVPAEVSQLPHFLKLLEIGIYLMLYRAYHPATADEWVNKFMLERRYRIEQGTPYVDLDFKALYRKASL